MRGKSRTYMNYDISPKWHGIIDYKSLIVFVIYAIVLWNAINIFSVNIEIKMYIFLFLSMPFLALLFSFENASQNALDVIIIIIRFMIKAKIYTSVNSKKTFLVNNKIYKNFNNKVNSNDRLHK